MAQKLLIREKVTNQFLQNPQVSEKNSLMFLQKLSGLALSSITYHRKIFPADAFLDKPLFGREQVKVLRDLDPETRTFVNWLKYAFSLVEKKYLWKMVFVIEKIHTDGSRQVVETYTINYEYHDEELAFQLSNEGLDQKISLNDSLGLPEKTSALVSKLLRSIEVMTSTLKPLPQEYEFSLRLEVDDNMPAELTETDLYHLIDDYDFTFPPDIMKWKMGKVPSKFSSCSITAKSVFLQIDEDHTQEERELLDSTQPKFQCSLSQPNKTQSPIQMTKAPEVDEEPMTVVSSGDNKTVVLSNLSLRLPSSSLSKEPMPVPSSDNNQTIVLSDLSLRLSSLSMKNKTINCICECEDDQFEEAVICTVCTTYQHRSCYNIPIEHGTKDHVCILCRNPNQNKLSSCPDLSSDINKDDALYRRALMLSTNETHMSSSKISKSLNVSRQKAQKIYNKLDFDGCFYHSSGRFGKKVDLDHIKNNIWKRYFASSISSKNTQETVIHAGVNNPKKRCNEEVEKSTVIVENTPPLQNKRRKLMNPSQSLQLQKQDY